MLGIQRSEVSQYNNTGCCAEPVYEDILQAAVPGVYWGIHKSLDLNIMGFTRGKISCRLLYLGYTQIIRPLYHGVYTW